MAKNKNNSSNYNAYMGSVDIGFLTETERDMIIDVLKRDEKLRTCEKKRVIQLKCELRDIRRKGAKKVDVTYGSHVCARCNSSTGHILHKAHTCPICKHKTCENCRVCSKDMWICIVCYKESKIKAKTGEWFFDAMRAELKPLADGSTLLKQAVLDTSRSNLTSMGSMDSLPSSTESHSYSPYKYGRFGPAETGSIESLRSLRYISRDYYSDSDQSNRSYPLSPARSSAQNTTPSMTRRLQSQHERETSHGATMPRMKPPLSGYSNSRDSVIHDSLSISTKSTVDRDPSDLNFYQGTGHKSDSLARQTLHIAGKKLHNQRVLSRSVPSLARPSSTPVVKEEERPMSIPETHSLRLSVPRPQQVSMSTSNIAESSRSESLSLDFGEIKFSLKFDYKENHLLVFIVECRNLSNADMHRKSCDPYVKCYLLPDRSVKKKTSPKKHTRSPKFNQELRFPVSMSELGNRVLEMSVWNSATFSKNSFLGHLQIALDSWKWQSSPSPHWYPLKRKEVLRSGVAQSAVYRGDVVLSVSYKSPESSLNKHGEIHVMVKQAKNLVPMLPNGTVEAFAKVSILPEKDVQEKTAAIGGGVNPLWNAKFRLPLLHRPVEESGLQIALWHKPRGHAAPRRSRKYLLGGVKLAFYRLNDGTLATATDEERLVWEKVCNSPGNWVDATLSLRSLL